MDRLTELVENPFSASVIIVIVLLVLFFSLFDVDALAQKRGLLRAFVYGSAATFLLLSFHYSGVSSRHKTEIDNLTTSIQKPLPSTGDIVAPQL